MGIVCLCHGITDKQVRDSIDRGNTGVLKIVRDTGAGSCCGACVEVILEMIGESNDQEDDSLCEAEG